MRRILAGLTLLVALLAAPIQLSPALAGSVTCQGAAACASLAQSCARQGGKFVANTSVNGQVSGSCTT